MKKTYFFALSLLTALPALADNSKGFYLGVGASTIKNELDGIQTDRLRTGELFGGYKYNDALGVELRLGNGLSNSKSESYLNGSGTEVAGRLEREIGSYQSIYYKPELINEIAKLYGLFGYTHINTSVKVLDVNGALVTKADDSFSGYSYGLGVGFVISDHWNINFEYKTICDDLNNKLDTGSINFDYRF